MCYGGGIIVTCLVAVVRGREGKGGWIRDVWRLQVAGGVLGKGRCLLSFRGEGGPCIC